MDKKKEKEKGRKEKEKEKEKEELRLPPVDGKKKGKDGAKDKSDPYPEQVAILDAEEIHSAIEGETVYLYFFFSIFPLSAFLFVFALALFSLFFFFFFLLSPFLHY